MSPSLKKSKAEQYMTPNGRRILEGKLDPIVSLPKKKERKIKAEEFVIIQDLPQEVVGIVAYKEGFVVATKNGLWTNVKSLITKVYKL